jgi:hypothetical protein
MARTRRLASGARHHSFSCRRSSFSCKILRELLHSSRCSLMVFLLSRGRFLEASWAQSIAISLRISSISHASVSYSVIAYLWTPTGFEFPEPFFGLVIDPIPSGLLRCKFVSVAARVVIVDMED